MRLQGGQYWLLLCAVLATFAPSIHSSTAVTSLAVLHGRRRLANGGVFGGDVLAPAPGNAACSALLAACYDLVADCLASAQVRCCCRAGRPDL